MEIYWKEALDDFRAYAEDYGAGEEGDVQVAPTADFEDPVERQLVRD
jgi:hypothetical protein